MDQLVPLIIEIGEALAAVGVNHIDLPQLVLVGEKSVGKSTILESFVRKEFLPLVTRRPLILQLHSSKEEEYGEFRHKKGQKFLNFEKIREEIYLSTVEATAGNLSDISEKPIHLSIYSPNVAPLIVVDLPGLIDVGDDEEPTEMSLKCRELTMDYIKKKTSSILAVSSALDDIANSPAHRIAREVDPNGERTLGILTKIDLMPEGTNCRKELESGKFVGVANQRPKTTGCEKETADISAQIRENYSRLTEKVIQNFTATLHGYNLDIFSIEFLVEMSTIIQIPELKAALQNALQNLDQDIPLVVCDLIKAEREKFKAPVQQGIELITAKLLHAIGFDSSPLFPKELNQHPTLKNKMQAVLTAIIQEQGEACEKFLMRLITSKKSSSEKLSEMLANFDATVFKEGYLKIVSTGVLGEKSRLCCMLDGTGLHVYDDGDKRENVLLNLTHGTKFEKSTVNCAFVDFTAAFKTDENNDVVATLMTRSAKKAAVWNDAFLRAGVIPAEGPEEALAVNRSGEPRMVEPKMLLIYDFLKSCLDSERNILENLVPQIIADHLIDDVETRVSSELREKVIPKEGDVDMVERVLETLLPSCSLLVFSLKPEEEPEGQLEEKPEEEPDA